MHKAMKFLFPCIVVVATIANLLLISCDEHCSESYCIDSLYGIWTYEDSFQYVRMELRNDGKMFYYYRSDSDSDKECNTKSVHKVFHTSKISEDSLIMSDCNQKSSIAIIKYYSDSIMKLENFLDMRGVVCLKRELDFFERNQKMEFFFPEDSLDYAMSAKGAYNTLHDFTDCVKGHQLTRKEISQTLALMNKCVSRDSVSFYCSVDKMYPLNWYVRQYAGYINSAGHVMVRVSLTLNTKELWEGSFDGLTPDEAKLCLKGSLNSMYVRDGGCDYADADIDLTQNKVLYFHTHGNG